jgi:hypothetical protein
MSAFPTLDTRICAYVGAMPAAISGSGGHVATLKVANALVLGFGLSIDDAWPYLSQYNERCEPPWSPRELAHKLAEADANKKNLVRSYLLDAPLPESMARQQPARQKPVDLTEEEKVKRWMHAVTTRLNGFEADPYEVWELSPIRLLECSDIDARTAIYWLHDREDLININFDYRPKPGRKGVDIVGPGITLSAAEWCEYLAAYPMPFREAGCWWRHNPVRSRQGSGKDGSFTDADIARFRYHLFEIDKLPLELQLSFWCKCRMPIAMISDSGGKSYHALVKSYARTLDEFQAEAEYLLDEVFARFGVDPKNKNASRYSRLPGVPREIGGRKIFTGLTRQGDPRETSAWQVILYLNPNPPKQRAIL